MNEEAKNYELAFLLVSEQNYNDLLEIVRANGIEVNAQFQPSKIKFAYPVKKENFGYFGNLYFSAATQDVKKLNQALGSSSKILRFFILNKPPMKEAENRKPGRSERYASETKKISEYIPRSAAAEKTGALSNEALEKRLEEILK